jgi:hypothetical protein
VTKPVVLAPEVDDETVVVPEPELVLPELLEVPVPVAVVTPELLLAAVV